MLNIYKTMNFYGLDHQYKKSKINIDSAIRSVIESSQFIMGPEIEILEKQLADYVGVKYCITVSSGTDALLIAMMSLGIGPGDEVITSPFSFISTSETIVFLGAKPVYVDIDQQTYNIDSTQIEEAITSKTKLILPVSLYGQCADFSKINLIAKKYNLPVIEDAAQSFGALHNNAKSCSLSTLGCTSFFPTKPLGCFGDGGAIFTNDFELFEIAFQIRSHGQKEKYNHVRLGVNGRLDTIQAAILLEKLKEFDNEIDLRHGVANNYYKLLNKSDEMISPLIQKNNSSVFAQYTIRFSNRDRVMKHLEKNKIPCVVHYPIPLHKQPCFESSKIKMPNAEKAAAEVLSIPIHPYLRYDEQKIISDTINEICN